MAELKTVLGRLKVKRDTTANWNHVQGFIPYDGEIIVYTDYRSKIVDNDTVYIPGIKIGTGHAFVQDLPFLGEYETNLLLNHINNTDIHITAAERTFWNNKININDASEVVDGMLIFNRD